jgi:hypothetical protein
MNTLVKQRHKGNYSVSCFLESTEKSKFHAQKFSVELIRVTGEEMDNEDVIHSVKCDNSKEAELAFDTMWSTVSVLTNSAYK